MAYCFGMSAESDLQALETPPRAGEVEPCRCLSCWYVVSDTPLDGAMPEGLVCPECGTPVTEMSRRIATVRSALIKESVRPAWVGFAVMVGGVFAYGVLAAFLLRSWWDVAGVFAVGVVAIALKSAGVLLVVPWRGSRRRAANPGIERRLVALLWLRHQAWLSVPWLLPVPSFVIMVVVMLVSPVVAPDREAAETIDFAAGLLVVAAGCMCLMVALTEWADRWNKHLDEALLRSTEVPMRSAIVAMAVGLVSIGLGSVGLIVLVGFAIDAKSRVHGW
jgi:MFS family permease